MECLRETKLYLRHEKCEFEKTGIKYLGIIISHNKVKIHPVKIAGVSEWPTPTNKRRSNPSSGLSTSTDDSFRTFCNMPALCSISPWRMLGSSGACPQEDVFVMLKGLVISAPVLALPDSNLPYHLEADASRVATGAVLSQQSRKDSKWHPVSF
jgi:hypothetical protein